jgi:hypothetical protein
MALKPVFDAFMAGKPILPEGTATNTTSAQPYVGGAAQAVLNKMPNISPLLKRALMKGVGGYEQGTDYVPSTGLYQLHKGEAVVPAGKNGNSSIVININNPSVQNPNDITKLSQALENVVRANLVDKQTGKTKYRMA